MKFLIGATAVAFGLLLLCSLKISRLAAGTIAAMLVYGILTLWSLGHE